MHITTSLSGRLRNTSLPLKKNGLLPVFEAVSNSIHAIEDAGIPMEQGKITLEIIREDQLPIDTGQATHAPITKFRITDNGVGFTGDNFQSFLTLDSQYKATRGGRGVGRLLWLKAFERATIESTFRDDEGNLSCRHFSFHSQGGVSETTPPYPSSDETQTCVELQYFKKPYQIHSPKIANTILNSLLAHCLWYYVRPGGAPHITLVDDFEQYDLDQFYELELMSPARSENS